MVSTSRRLSFCRKLKGQRGNSLSWPAQNNPGSKDYAGGDRYSHGTMVRTPEREPQALEPWLRAATSQQIADLGIGVHGGIGCGYT